MRQWVEKLATISKERGQYYDQFTIRVDNIRWSLIKWNGLVNLHVKLIKEDILDSIKIYEDEYDLLESVYKYLKVKNQDYIINQLNNLQ
jgi:hypothetical protein